MISYVSVGADDIPRAKRFYSAFLPALGYGLEEGPEGLSYVLPVPHGGDLRDPQGNKTALSSSNPDEPGRDD